MNKVDIILDNISVSIAGTKLIDNSQLRIIFGRKYGIIGKNGCGKSCLLKKIMSDEFNIQLDRFYVDQEIKSSNTDTVYEAVLKANYNRTAILEELNKIEKNLDFNNEIEKYQELIKKISLYNNDEAIIRKILYGLGFNHIQQNQPISLFSGGWRMRISLARALYIKPSLLMLDEPTNHLDLNATIWLIDYLINTWKNSLIVVSHDQNFLNDVCTDIIHISENKLRYYEASKYGAYDSFKKQYDIDIKNREIEFNNLTKKIKENKAKSVSKKIIDKLVEKANLIKPPKIYKININFPSITKSNGIIVQLQNVQFSYDNNLIYDNLDFDITHDSRITIVGKNGTGKSTLFKLIAGDIKPTNGEDKIYFNRKLKIGYFHQHTIEYLPLDSTPVKYICSLNKEINIQEARQLLGGIGLEGNHHLTNIVNLSGGQKTRIALLGLIIIQPQVLLLDEPTNHLDIETVNALIKGINNYNGAVIMITHDINLITNTNSNIFEVLHKKLIKTTYEDYKEKILNELNNLSI